MLDQIILGILSGSEEISGYDLKKIIETGVGVFYKASYGSLYPALKKLEGHGQVIAVEQPTGGRMKKNYHITAAGSAAFLSWLAEPAEIADGAASHLAKVYFFDRLPPDNRKRQIVQYENSQLQYLRKLQQLEQKFSACEGMEPHYYKLSTLYYGIVLTQETLRWCRHIREEKPLRDLLERGEGER